MEGVDTITIEIENVSHGFKLGKLHLPVLHNINETIKQGELVALVGASGSGKSTLLNLIGGLDRPLKGDIKIHGQSLNKLNENQLCVFRQKNIGFIFQSYNLIPLMTALENVELPLLFGGVPPKVRKEKAREMLKIVGLEDRMNHKPNELSGGQQQRVSIARALVANASIILADEPTGNLDSRTEAEIIELMHRLNKENNQTFIIVTHDQSVADSADRKIILKDGYVVSSLTDSVGMGLNGNAAQEAGANR